MYLKRLDLVGFKTFADESKLEFRPGITAVVGPNGSGKSNLADAIQWVMGERSMKQLRGARPANLIFAGNGQRKPVGMAEVSLTLDNADGALGIDFSEVTVTRRVFRSGESNYLINKSACRLRDIHELFLDTGLGPDAYSIISQSEIDAILSLRAEDRRALFEEVAGIQKYRFKRHETKLKLDRTERNLTRVRDILHELDSELGPLAEQAELAREYENYQVRLKQLQLGLLAREYDVRRQRRERLEQEHHERGLEIEGAVTAVATLEAAADEIDLKLIRMEKEIVKIQEETTRIVSQVKSTEGKIAVSQERERALTERRERAVQESADLADGLEAMRVELREARDQEAQLQSEVSRLGQETVAKERHLGELDAEIQREAGNLELRREEYLEHVRQGAEKRNAIAACEATSRGLTTQVETARKSLGNARAELSATEGARAEAELALETGKAELTDRTREARETRESLTQVEGERDRATERVAALREQLSDHRSRLQALTEREANLEGVAAGVQTVLRASQSGELSGVCGSVAQLLRAPQECEAAIELALGPALQYVVVVDEPAARAGIELLSEKRAGRATFLPLSGLLPTPADADLRELAYAPGVVGLGVDLVRFDLRHRAAVQYLLGRVIVVRDGRFAAALARRAPRACTLVTLTGEVFLPGGALAGGKGSPGQGGLLSRKREIGELSASVATLNAELGEQTRYAEAVVEQIAELRDELTDREAARAELAQEVARQERNVLHLGDQLARLNATVDQHAEDLRSLDSEILACQEAGAAHRSELQRIEGARQALDHSIAEGQSSLDEKRQSREVMAHAVNDSRVRFASVRERLVGVEKSRQSLVSRERQTHHALTVNHETIAAADQEMTFLRKIVETDKAALEALTVQQEEMEQSFLRWRETRQAAMDAQAQTSAKLREQRTKQHGLEEDCHRVELRLTQTMTETEELERRFLEEHGLQPDEAVNHKDDLENKSAAEEEAQTLKQKMTSLGEVNLGALAEYDRKHERYDFLNTQVVDLEDARAKCEEIIAEIDANTKAQFMATFDAVMREFAVLFVRIFGGGSARLVLTDPTNILETGIDVRIQLPGKAEQDLLLLSGGERALTALSLLLSMLRVKPSPFCVLDEVDAPLDESNVGKFAELLREFAQQSQFIVVTHNKGTMEAADALYGVTMEKAGVSKLVSVRLEDALAHAGIASPEAPEGALAEADAATV